MRRPFARTRKSNRKRHNRSRSFVSERLEDRQLLAADVVGGIFNDLNGDGVRDQGEDGLANWTVYLDQNQNGTLDSGEDSTLTDADGKYSFTGLVAGNYRVAEVVRSGWTATNPTTGYVDITLANGDERSVNFLNEGAGGTGIITGNVWRDINNDGIKDPEDTPLANWTVFMDLSGDNILDVDEPFVLTDAEGNYTFTGVLGGAGTSALDYEIAHVIPAGWEPNNENATAAVLEGETTVMPDFSVWPDPEQLSGVSGRVYNDANGNGIQDAGESGLGGITVFADLNLNNVADAGEPFGTTSAAGNYSIFGVETGTVRIAQETPAAYKPTYPSTGSQNVVVSLGTTRTGVNFGNQLRTDAAIGGTIYVDRDHDSIRDTTEEGLAGITVYLDEDDDGVLDVGERSMITSEDLFYTPDIDEAGTYLFEDLALGTYTVRHIIPEELSSTPTSETAKSVTLGPGDFASIDCGDRYRPSEIHGTKFEDLNGDGSHDSGEPGVEGVTIFLDLNRNNVLDAGEPTTLTDVDGQYSFSGLDAGAYIVREVVPFGWTQTFPDTRDGILWPEGVSNSAVGNVTPSLIEASLDIGESLTQTVSLTLPTTGAITDMVDVFLLFDDTGSFTFNSPIVRAAFPNIITELETRLPGIDLGFGVGRLEEYGGFAAEYGTGRPFVLNQPIVSASPTGYTDAEVLTSIQAALDHVAPGYGGDRPETVIEALYQMVTGAGFDGNNDGDTTDSGPAGAYSTQVSPGTSGDVPAFSSFTADTAHGGLDASGNIGGAGFRSGALPIIITATDTGFAYQPKGDTTITGVDGLTLPASSIAFNGRATTPYDSGAGIQETVTGLNALGALVIGLGTTDAATSDPRIGLESLASLTGAINRTSTTIANGTPDAIDPGDPFYFKIGSGGDPLVGNIADGIVAAIEGAVTSVSVNVTLRASDPRVHIDFTPGVINGLGAGDTATFDVTFTGDGRPHRFDLQFVREGTDVVLGSIPVVLGTPVAGDGYEYEDCDDGVICVEANFGNQRTGDVTPNVAPSFTAGANQSTDEDSGAQTVVAWATNISPGPSSEAGQSVNFIVSNDNASLFSVPPAISPDGSLTFTPAPNAFGSANVTVQLHDDGGTAAGGVDTSATQTFLIEVVAVNDAPTAEDNTYSLDEDGVLSIDAASGVLSNDADIDSATLTAVRGSGPTNGSLTLNADGSFTYTPNADFNGTDTFSYSALDGTDLSEPATVEITVNAVNDAPVGAPTIGVTEASQVTFPAGTPITNIFNTGSMSSVVERNGYSFTMTGLNTYGLMSINTSDFDGSHPDGGGLLMRQSDYGRYPVIVRRVDGQPFGIRTAAIREDGVATGLQIPVFGKHHETGVTFSNDFQFDRNPTTYDVFDFAAADERFLSVDYVVIYPVESPVVEPIITTHTIDYIDAFSLAAPTIIQSSDLLTANAGDISDADGLGPFSYQWMQDGTPISGANTDAYLLSDADNGTMISVQVSYTDGGGTVEVLTSDSIGPVGGSTNSLPTGEPVISGVPAENQTLSVDTSSIADADGLGAFSYHWSTGATAPAITLSDADVGTEVFVTVLYTDGNGTVESLTSAAVGPVANVNSLPTGAVAISGVATEGETLTADVSTIADADGLGTFSYLWSTGATTPAIMLGDADVGSNISVTVSYTDGHGTYESLTSAAVGPVANLNNSPTGIPVISGVAQNGQTLTANTGGISDADGLGEFTFEWLRNDAVIAGASSNTYLLSDIDVGSQIRVQVSYVDNHGTTEGPITSDPTGTVTDVLSSGTKFFVVDQSRRRTFEYGADGSALDNSRLDKEDQGPRGIAASIDGSTLWVVDQKGEVFVYDSENNSLGSWEFEGVDKAEGIAVHGDDLWIVDRGEDRVYYFADGALRRSEKAEPTSSFSLVRGNRNPLGITTDGEHIWVVNNTKSTDKVFRYSIEGELEGSWRIDTANASPTGITIDPNDVNDVWIVDAISDHVYQYVGAAERTDGMQLADAQFPLAENNRNPQGIADPRPNSTGTASSFHPIDKATISSAMSAARSHTPAARTSSDPQLTRDLVFAEFVQDRKTARRKLDSEFGWQSPDAQFESELVRTDAAAYGERDRLFSMIEDSDDH